MLALINCAKTLDKIPLFYSSTTRNKVYSDVKGNDVMQCTTSTLEIRRHMIKTNINGICVHFFFFFCSTGA
jgi:hypothetical protein